MHCKLGKKLLGGKKLGSRGESLRRDCSLGQHWRLKEGWGERGKEIERETKGSIPQWKCLGDRVVRCGME